MKKILITLIALFVLISDAQAFTGSGIFQMAASSQATYTVTTAYAGGDYGSESCTSPVNAGATTTCTITPDSGYSVTVDTDYCDGSWSAPTYTTGAVNQNCIVTATYTAVIWVNNVGRWRLGNTTWTDTSGQGNTLTMNGTLTSTAGHSSGANLASSSYSSSNYLSINDNSSLSITGNITMSAWIYITSQNVNNIIFEKAINSGQYGYDFFVWNSGNKLYCRLSNNGATQTAAIGATGVSANTWHHVACVYNGTDIRVYLDGSLDSNSTNNPKTYSGDIYNGTDPLYIGKLDATNYMRGNIDDAAIWGRALSSTEISTIYGGTDDFGGL
jgi:hypothetical protein